jgi:predicted methyltransferase
MNRIFLAFTFLALTLSVIALPGLIAAAYADSAHGSTHRVSIQSTQQALFEIIESDSRPDKQRRRDQYRHPLATLSFFGIEPTMTVVEIWPGGQGGFYRRILSPFLDKSGLYIPLVSSKTYPAGIEPVEPNSADMVLVFRAHGFMIYDHPAQDYFDAIFKMLKPGGTFGIVEHRGDEQVPQDPKGESGYVNQSHVLKLARNAGFKLIASTELNANPKDTKDHPDGLYSLPPTLRGSTFDQSARKTFLDIGESDRMTLKFQKASI